MCKLHWMPQGCATIGVPHSEVFPYVVLELTPVDFVGYLYASTDGCEFKAFCDAMTVNLQILRTSEHCPENTRLVILLIGFD